MSPAPAKKAGFSSPARPVARSPVGNASPIDTHTPPNIRGRVKGDRKTIERVVKAVEQIKQHQEQPQPKKSSSPAITAAVVDNDQTDGSNATKNGKPAGKKRGRKLTDPNKYFFESQKKIEELQSKLKTDKKLSADEKQKIRNQISAQRSRQNKKQEHQQFAQQIDHFKDQFSKVVASLNQNMKCKCREAVVNDLLAKMPNTTAFEELPDLQPSSSAPTAGAGVARLTRQGSQGTTNAG